MGKTIFYLAKGKTKNVLSFSLFLAFKETKKQTLFQTPPLKMENNFVCADFSKFQQIFLRPSQALRQVKK